jgi:low affinity Fe/Cu permease
MAGQRQKNGTAEGFQTFATKVSCWMGSRWSFLGAMLIIIVWAVLGPYFHYSDTWQLVVNTATTIVTFLMVFLIQNTQNRDARAIHLKLDEIIRSIQPAHNEMINIEKRAIERGDQLAGSEEQLRCWLDYWPSWPTRCPIRPSTTSNSRAFRSSGLRSSGCRDE